MAEAEDNWAETGEPDLQALENAPDAIMDLDKSGVDVVALPSGETPADLKDLKDLMEKGFSDLLQTFDERLALTQHKERQIDTLHQELQAHRQGLVLSAIKPLLSGLVRLHDDIGRMAAILRGKSTEEVTPLLASRVLMELQDDIGIVLEENGISIFQEPVERFDPRRQFVSQTVTTNDPNLVGTISKRMRPGFEREGQLLQKERVEVFVGSSPALPDSSSLATEHTPDSTPNSVTSGE